MVHVLKIVSHEQGEATIKACEQVRALVPSCDRDPFEQISNLCETLQVVVMILCGVGAGARTTGLQRYMKDAVLIVEVGVAHGEVILNPGNEVLDSGVVACVGGADIDEAAHVRGADALVNGAVGIVSGLAGHIAFLVLNGGLVALAPSLDLLLDSIISE